jgi:hypothetical protein
MGSKRISRALPSMRSLPLRCLILVLALALVSGNTHAELHLGALHPEPCPEAHDHRHGTPAPHHRAKHAHDACCCDCLGCVPTLSLTPDLVAMPVSFSAAVIRYRDEPSFLAGRALVPDPGPPRPSAAS